MDPTIPTPTVCSTISSSSSISTQAPPPTPLHLLEISLISAQDLTPISKSMRTYAVAWVNPNRKLTTRTDQHHRHPTWNDKLTFRVDNQVLSSPNTAINVEIYTVSWFRDVLVGTVRVLISDLFTPPTGTPLQNRLKNTRFIALQVRRPTGTPQGILNMGVSLVDNTMRSMQLQHHASNPPGGENFHDAIEEKVNDLSIQQQKNEHREDENKEQDKKIQLWRSLSVGSEINNDDFPLKTGSVCNGSMVNGSELCSDIGPSASIVAADLARKLQPLPLANRSYRNTHEAEETGSSILEELTFEEAIAKGSRTRTTRERWRKEMYDCDESELSSINSRHSRRNSDGGLFSCFGTAYGIEFTIVCGASNNPSSNKHSNSMNRRKNSLSDLNSD